MIALRLYLLSRPTTILHCHHQPQSRDCSAGQIGVSHQNCLSDSSFEKLLLLKANKQNLREQKLCQQQAKLASEQLTRDICLAFTRLSQFQSDTLS